MTDNITLPRAVGVDLLNATKSRIRGHGPLASQADINALAALDAALAEPEQPQKARPDFLAGYDAGLADGRRCAERAAQDARDAAIVAAALAEPDAKREPATDKQIIASWPTELPYLPTPHAFYKGFRAAERHHGITKEDK